MPRRPDPGLEDKILDAAQKLWKKGGERALTMRGVARTAKTNTPTVYRRFRDRDDILRGILRRIRLEIAAELEEAASTEGACQCYLDYALSHPHEYELLFQRGYELERAASSQQAKVKPVGYPARDAMRRKLRKELGNSSDQEPLLTSLWMVVHGAAMLLIAKSIPPEDEARAREAFRSSVAVLLRNAGK
ncbi:MAG: TetR/AcrR family transcriptional regulator [Candidatus Sulfotelmatobacter sp.]